MYRDSVETDTFYRDFMVKLVRRLSEVFMEKTRYIKLRDYLHIEISIHRKYLSPYSFTIKSPQKVSFSILSPYYPRDFFIL